MKIITWNCNMAFRKKADFILEKKPDVLIIPECENPDKLIFKNETIKPTDLFWFGKNPNKGIGVFTYSDFKISLLDIHNPEFKYVIPLSVYNDKIKLTIFQYGHKNPKDMTVIPSKFGTPFIITKTW